MFVPHAAYFARAEDPVVSEGIFITEDYARDPRGADPQPGFATLFMTEVHVMVGGNR
jgi:hypothetical protein